MEESQEFAPDAVHTEESSMLENLPTSLSLVKKKRRSYGTAVVGTDESPQKETKEATETNVHLQDMDDDSIATEAKSLGGEKDLFDMDDEFFDEDEFNHDEILNDDHQSHGTVDRSEVDQTEDIVEDYTQGATQDDLVENEKSDNDNINTSNTSVEPDDDVLRNEKDDQLQEGQKVVATTDNSPESSTGESIQKPEVSDQDILDTVDTLFSDVDINTVTVKDIVRSIEDLFQIKIKKARKAIIKERLFYLINRNGQDESEEEQEEEEEEEAKDEPSDEEFEPENEEDDDLPKSSSARPRISRTPKQRKPSHVKIHHEMMRKRQIAEAKVRAEELQDQSQKKLSEEDRKRAELIAKKFETDNEEIRIKRMEDRIGLLSKLEQKRLMILKEEEDLDIVLVSLKQNSVSDTIAPSKDSEKVDEESESDDDDSDDELDIIDEKKNESLETILNFKQRDAQLPDSSRKSSPKSVLAYFAVAGNNQTENKTKRKQFANPRVALRNALKAKQFENGNIWLAKQLDYKDVQEHLKKCSEVEKKTRQQIVTLEEARIRQATERNERLKSIVKGEALEVEEGNIDANDEKDEDEMSTNSTARNGVYDQSESDGENEEEDEEVALAREIEEKENDRRDLDQIVDDHVESEVVDQEDPSSNVANDETQSETIVDDSTQVFHADTAVSDTNDTPEETTINSNASEHESIPTDVPVSKHIVDRADNVDDDIGSSVADNKEVQSDDEKEFDDSKHDSQSKVPKNTAWKEMLKKEAEKLKKQKALRKNSTLVEEEAEEEEEEEGVAGLEDFGFTLNTKKKETEDDEDNDDDMDDEDFEDIVDEVSDNEGDEEAGEAGRKAMALREEKARHKEIIRRMREGYDGKRGGIAGGGEARGNLRFDQLVAADNRDDARRLGLLNDDELDSDDENGVANDNDEIEDEEDLDKMIKDRHLNRTEIPDEEFSDSDDDNEDDDVKNGDGAQGENDEDDKEQERLAKRFARRARMNRLLELHGDDKEFSQSRLIEQDQTMQMELKSIRNVHSKRRQTSVSSFTFAGDSNSFHGFPKRQSSSSSSSGTLQSKFLSSSSSLALAINQSRKRKASFLGTGTGAKAAIKAPSISLGHVVFGGGSQQSNMSRSASLPMNKSANSATYKRSKSDTLSTSKSSLWSRVAAGGFQKNKK